MKDTKEKAFRDTRAELASLLKKKEELEKSLGDVEEQIYAFETGYLKQTQDTGNCIRGWYGYLNNPAADKSQAPCKFRESDRLFSYSSATSYTLLGREKLKREKEKKRRRNIQKHKEIMAEFPTTTTTKKSDIATNDTQELEQDDINNGKTSVHRNYSTATTISMSSVQSISTKKKQKISTKRLRNKRSVSDSSRSNSIE
ncbi:unnamed protein product [Didymodactylos carnosus]|uniref:Chromatin modification-related protein MEAF6 n=1 Tax=Didymodactylos carnosus TaxID=1234261 RepID=A0A815S0I7_9BILA|nr:unnamed protein product [Didymodactylos carnosus]CAF1541789.1 unnamed protein product [Didymodactylos carnosus]CAF4330216.1 unnamed protein product [Didymodactylos carnosus]CAF4347413.1 unnamed protein product [Didymodactylos carnosus]